MRKNIRLAYLALALGAVTANAQQTQRYTNEFTEFKHAVNLYNEEQYLAAQLLFQKVKTSQQALNTEIEADCAYYIANCAIRLNQSNAEQKIDDFVSKYPTSAKQHQAYLDVTDYYFNKGDYRKALHYATKIKKPSYVGALNEDKFNFQKGYSFFYVKNVKEAKRALRQVRPGNEWGDQAAYYLGYMAYDSNNVEDAEKLFEMVGDKSKYQDRIGYYRADMNFKSGNFEKAISEGLAQIEKTEEESEKSELQKMVGESFFNVGQFEKALPYLVEYKGKEGKWSNTDYYQLGYTYYKQKDYEKAIEQFNKIISGNDPVAQNAYYHLGESYLHTHKKTQALNAFKNASEMSFNKDIQEDAFLNYAKLSYEIGNAFESAPSVLNSFMLKYPNSPHKEEIEGLLIDSYITSKNYKDALNILENSHSKGNAEVYQKVLLYRGLELFSNSDYTQALELFSRASSEDQDFKVTAKALYWKAESMFALDKFNQAIDAYDDFKNSQGASSVEEFKNVDYNIGYTYFKIKEYQSAISFFNSFVSQSSIDATRKYDAYLRIGDCNFVLGKYWPAMDAYNVVIDANQQDIEYAKFQKAISYGFVDRTQKKVDDLLAFVKDHPLSTLADKAQYELGVGYDVLNQKEKALQAYDKLILDFPSSIFKSRAMLRQGLIYYSQGKADIALSKFKQVVSSAPNTPEAVEAVQNARLVYVDKGQVDQYAAWVKGLDFISVSESELDSDTFESAERQFIQNNKQEAIKGYESYLKNYPNGQKALQAHYYLAQMYLEQKNEDKAVAHYENLLKFGKSEYSELALVRTSEIYLKRKDQAKSIEKLLQLDKEAVQEQNKIFALSNLMKVYYNQKEYSKALANAEKVLQKGALDARVSSDAKLIIARTAFATANEDKARTAYQDVLKQAKGEVAAEAMYYDAYFKNKDAKYEASNEVVQKLAKDYSSYKYYGAKGLLLMAKNFYALNDSYQATYILESVVKNFGDYADVKAEALQELNLIKQEEAKHNSSIAN
ncbi:tetratricopeptide repeat protein [Myroides albus]|uniref:Tetratricopeptide repeat protein n=1 Tax=Myroides albus TaxID=2562892 RepID=A0A6I3LHS0_9FLAO|nr:tetratricopeptide repeat protein [Myroides albus]MTG97387.1 tetratricopeptide repeat protein [Myroides albus]UVD79416.1 tetratricopeptide repeat protein [Myroides albus]